jgi:hypothetical protein
MDRAGGKSHFWAARLEVRGKTPPTCLAEGRARRSLGQRPRKMLRPHPRLAAGHSHRVRGLKTRVTMVDSSHWPRAWDDQRIDRNGRRNLEVLHQLVRSRHTERQENVPGLF